MTEPGRIDLGALDREDRSREDRVIGAAMARIGSRPKPLLDDVGGWWRPGLAAAAAVIVIAGGILAARGRSSAADPPVAAAEEQLFDWVQSGHVPANEELLATFSGYSR